MTEAHEIWRDAQAYFRDRWNVLDLPANGLLLAGWIIRMVDNDNAWGKGLYALGAPLLYSRILHFMQILPFQGPMIQVNSIYAYQRNWMEFVSSFLISRVLYLRWRCSRCQRASRGESVFLQLQLYEHWPSIHAGLMPCTTGITSTTGPYCASKPEAKALSLVANVPCTRHGRNPLSWALLSSFSLVFLKRRRWIGSLIARIVGTRSVLEDGVKCSYALDTTVDNTRMIGNFKLLLP